MNELVADYLPLARLTLCGKFAGSERERWEWPLAQLLEAASRGKGQLRLSECRVGHDAPPEFFSLEGDQVLLPRNAAFWREIRSRVEALHAAPNQRLCDAAVRGALDEVLPAYTEVHEGQVVFDNCEQRLAVAAFVDVRAGVLTGAPGTGKTTSAAALLAVRKRLEPGLSPDDVLLCAPTGKAACRLADSMRAAASRLLLTPIERDFLYSLQPRTIHRALEWGPRPPERGGPFGRGLGNPLSQKWVIVDEASMVDLHLMAHLLRALSPRASLLLLGDSDQLESVDAGGVLAELVVRGTATFPTADQLILWRNRVGHVNQEPTGSSTLAPDPQRLAGLVVRLRYSHRARRAPWVIELANVAKPEAKSTAADFIACCHRFAQKLRLHEQRASFNALCLEQWKSMQAATAHASAQQPPADSELLQLLGRFQLLCATNAQVQRANRLGLMVFWHLQTALNRSELPHGCPVLVTENRPTLGLSNGDVGVALGANPGQAATVVVFPGYAAPLPIAQLPPHVPAFGLTIHKSQGSEWEKVAVDLPYEGDVLDRNLLYTAITRSSGTLDFFVNGMKSLEWILQRCPE